MDSLSVTDTASKNVATAPRVSLSDIEAAIAARYDHTGASLLGDAEGLVNPVYDTLRILSICILVMKNGFIVIGKSAPVSKQNFHAGTGRQLAYEDAVRQLWPLMGYALRERISHGW